MSPRADALLPGWPAGTAPTFDDVLRLVTRQHPKMPPQERKDLAHRSIAMIERRAREPLRGVVEEAEEVTGGSAESQGTICILAVEDDPSLARIVYERTVPRRRVHQEAFAVATVFVRAAQQPDQIPGGRWGHTDVLSGGPR